MLRALIIATLSGLATLPELSARVFKPNNSKPSPSKKYAILTEKFKKTC
jgi:hypothetical protein